jgi:apolipoprotein N-acyltransferase
VILSGLAGLALAFSVPPWGWWPLAFVAFALLSGQLAVPEWRVRARRGAVFAFFWFAPSVVWMLDFSLPGYLAVVVIWGGLWAVAALACPPGRWRWPALPGIVVLTELVRWTWPFGGAPLSTVAVSQADAPLAPTVRVLGSLLLVALVVVVGVGLDAVRERAWVPAGACLAVVLGALLVAGVAPDGSPTGELDVAVVQGGGPQRTRAADTDEREVFERHLEASEDVEPPVDLVVWPENVVNVEGPISEHREGEELSELARRLDAPLVVGVVEGDGDGFHNSALVYDSDGELVARFEKVRRVPFGEYVPLRGLLEPFAGDALPDRDAIAGTEPAVVDTEVGRLGVVISWEVFFATRTRDAVSHGGEVVLNPTNGSSYWLTIVQTQQVASSRLRALETGRWVVQAAPTGFSAFVTPDGDVLQRTSISERAVIRQTIETRTGETWYTTLGDWPMTILALLALAFCEIAPLRHARRDKSAQFPREGV